jgi:hypothetical protein
VPEIRRFCVVFPARRSGKGLAATGGMKRILGMAAAAVLVLLQLAGLAALSAEPAMYLTPIDAPEIAEERRA